MDINREQFFYKLYHVPVWSDLRGRFLKSLRADMDQCKQGKSAQKMVSLSGDFRSLPMRGAPSGPTSETKASPNGPPRLHTRHRSSSCVQAPNLNAVTSSTCILDAFLRYACTRVRNASRSERENLWTQHNLNHLTNHDQDRIPFLNKKLTTSSFLV
jgi:hypothetical protein